MSVQSRGLLVLEKVHITLGESGESSPGLFPCFFSRGTEPEQILWTEGRKAPAEWREGHSAIHAPAVLFPDFSSSSRLLPFVPALPVAPAEPPDISPFLLRLYRSDHTWSRSTPPALAVAGLPESFGQDPTSSRLPDSRSYTSCDPT
ncbi:hypothetical protein M5K25_004269 [Dendrobium thyrsiflorum]|uniref:Uncharacterized protein n=1 Tax=Dendrobium thyrsiflorum TaxID=117978 RepID=A0ABD0VMC3_DENTH